MMELYVPEGFLVVEKDGFSYLVKEVKEEE